MRKFNLFQIVFLFVFYLLSPVSVSSVRACSSSDQSLPAGIIPSSSIFYGGSPQCFGVLSYRFEPIVLPGNSQTYTDSNGNSITISISNSSCGMIMSWEVTPNVKIIAIDVKGGGPQSNNMNRFYYQGLNLTSDGNLHTPVNPSNGNYFDISHVDFCYELLPFQPVLPIEMLEFTVKKDDSNVYLEWATASEKNNNSFIIEKMTPFYDFQEVGEIPGAGNSSAIVNYRFIDKNPGLGENIYRLKQTDFDGNYTYTEIRSINFKTGDHIHIYYNQSLEELNIKSENQELSIIIFNINGAAKEIFSSGQSEIFIPVDHFISGLYTAIVESESSRKVFKFIKL